MNLPLLRDTVSQGMYGFHRSLKESGIRSIMKTADGFPVNISSLNVSRVTGQKNKSVESIDNLIYYRQIKHQRVRRRRK